ncbi:hypothetical protein BCR32DRAFT_284142 [Anaeromyces robustus]|uniref:Dickkopf N-terminal cysteine-rich domain-containing protein n=1 Tax=Anaeromyces robustus TaxID=1754192 RepID=A0A1Y1WSF5_9FUNG|nr:hypothetical protein BCR32DRAFT_284142 [Anaeromyces robustus]|eukprot:ORX76470.1 hypothetical protein BCR32DRAFT_284142 [Anaeromyces robustus]
MKIFKLHNILVLLLLLIFLCSNISCENLTKENILQLTPQKCTEDEECSSGIPCYKNICRRIFYCHDNDCIEKTKEMSFNETITKDNYLDSKTTDLILESCPEELRNMEKCFTRFCNDNINCFSNICSNNTCIANNAFVTYECLLNSDNSGYYCTKPSFEKCEKDKECDPGFCNDDHVCSYEKRPYLFYGLLKLFAILIGAVIMIIILIILLHKCYRKKDKSKNIN